MTDIPFKLHYKPTQIGSNSSEIPGPMTTKREMHQLDGSVKTLTVEQANNRDIILTPAIVSNTKTGAKQVNNIIILAAAGTGKTTSCLAIPYFAANERFLLLTFNNELCGNTKQRVENDWGLANTDVYTFHGFMNRYFGKCRNDIDLFELLAQPGLRPKTKLPKWSRMALDEFQDANYGIYAISQIILSWQFRQYQEIPQLVILGDTLQCLYEYSGADRRFISLAHLIYPSPCGRIPSTTSSQYAPSKFTTLKLTETFRCTRPMVDFINHVMLGYEKMRSNKPGIKPQLHICNIFDITDKHPIFMLVLELIKRANNNYGRIAIISPAIRGNKFIIKLENLLSERGVPIYVSANETDVKNERRLSNGKLVITSVHKAKGREWPYVLVLGFDNYWEMQKSMNNDMFCDRLGDNTDETEFQRENQSIKTNLAAKPPHQKPSCPDLAYVAVSRAETELHLVQHFMNDLPGYVNFTEFPKYVDIREYNKRPINKKDASTPKLPLYRASEIARHMDISVIRQAISKLGLTQLNPPGLTDSAIIQTPNEYVAPNGTVEDISAINGVAVPVWYECQYRDKQPEILPAIQRMLGADEGQVFRRYYNSKWHDMKPLEYTIRDVLQMANLYIGLRDGYLYICRQMSASGWDWITLAQLNEAARRINEVIQRLIPGINSQRPPKLQFEKSNTDRKRCVSGCIDLYTPMTVFEFKFKSGLATEDILQTALSMILGHNIGLAELFETVDSMTDARIQSLDQIKVGHTVFILHNYNHVPARVTNILDGQLICQLLGMGIQSKQPSLTTEGISTPGSVIIDKNFVLADLTWLKQQGYIHDKQGILFNIRSGEIIQVDAKLSELDEMIAIILKEKERLLKTDSRKHITDTKFLRRCLQIRDGIWSGSGINF